MLAWNLFDQQHRILKRIHLTKTTDHNVNGAQYVGYQDEKRRRARYEIHLLEVAESASRYMCFLQDKAMVRAIPGQKGCSLKYDFEIPVGTNPDASTVSSGIPSIIPSNKII